MSPATAALLANLRAELANGALYVAISSTKQMVAIFPQDIVGKSDDELLAFVRERLEQG